MSVIRLNAKYNIGIDNVNYHNISIYVALSTIWTAFLEL